MLKERRIIKFPQGIPGLDSIQENLHTFMFIPDEDPNSSIASLISIENSKIGFVIFSPEIMFKEYCANMEVKREEVATIQVEATTPIDIWVIVTVNHADVLKSTANMKDPIIINLDKNLGLQLVRDDVAHYTIKHPIFLEEPKEGEWN